MKVGCGGVRRTAARSKLTLPQPLGADDDDDDDDGTAACAGPAEQGGVVVLALRLPVCHRQHELRDGRLQTGGQRGNVSKQRWRPWPCCRAVVCGQAGSNGLVPRCLVAACSAGAGDVRLGCRLCSSGPPGVAAGADEAWLPAPPQVRGDGPGSQLPVAQHLWRRQLVRALQRLRAGREPKRGGAGAAAAATLLLEPGQWLYRKQQRWMFIALHICSTSAPGIRSQLQRLLRLGGVQHNAGRFALLPQPLGTGDWAMHGPWQAPTPEPSALLKFHKLGGCKRVSQRQAGCAH